jgi:hypothetical protein
MFAAQRNGNLFASEDSGATWFKIDARVPELTDMKAAHA